MQVPATQVESEKVANLVGTFLKEDNSGSQFRKAIGYTYQDVVLESVQVLATQAESEKVTNLVGTFLKEDSSEGLRIIKVTTKADG